MDNLNWIKNFSKIKISEICKELGIDRSNLLNGRLSSEKELLVKETILKKLEELDK